MPKKITRTEPASAIDSEPELRDRFAREFTRQSFEKAIRVDVEAFAALRLHGAFVPSNRGHHA